jgi:hypothetical protein
LIKGSYLKRFDEDFVFHFNLLAAKYQIDESIQMENIFSNKEFEAWMSEFYERMSQIKSEYA